MVKSRQYFRTFSVAFVLVVVYVVAFAILIHDRRDRAALLVTLGFLLFMLGLLFRSLQPMVATYQLLKYLFAAVARNPDSVPSVPHSAFRVGSDEQQLLSDFGVMMERIQADRAALVERERELAEREVQYRSVFEGTSDGLILRALDGRVVEANPAICAMHGYDRDEFMALAPGAFVHPDSADVFQRFSTEVQENGSTRVRSINVRKDGTPIDVEVHGSLIVYRGEPHVLAVVRDITDRIEGYRLLEQRVAERTRELETLLDVSKNIASTLHIEPLLELILDQLGTMVEYQGAAILTFDGTAFSMLAYRAPEEAPGLRNARIHLQRTKRVRSILTAGKPIIVCDIHGHDSTAAGFRRMAGDLMAGFGYVRSFLGVPLLLKDRPIGLLALGHKQPDHYTWDHSKLASAVAQQAAVAMENALLFEQARNAGTLEARARLARDLHDSVTQALFSMTMHVRVAEMAIQRQGVEQTTPLAQSVKELAVLTHGALAEMRALIFELRPGALAQEGLVAAIRKQAMAVSAREGLAITVDAPADTLELPGDVEEHLYRIVQEALHNTVKHARAHTVRIAVQVETGGRLVIDVDDDGMGFDPERVPPGHLGIGTMADRCAHINAVLQVQSAPRAGTHVRIVVPAQETAATGSRTQVSANVEVHSRAVQ